MKTLFVLFYLLSLSGAIAVLFKRQIEETIVGVLFSIIIIIYITGLFCGTLLCGFYLCIFAGGTSFLYLGWSLSKDWRMVKNHCITPGLVIFIALFAWIWWINRYRVFSIWDEFSHWGLVVKNMDFFDYFGNHPDSTVTFRGYPPAMALWQYFIVKLYGSFKECYVYRAMGWLIAAIGVSLASGYTWKKFGYAAVFVLFVLAVPFIYNDTYLTSIYVDVVLGILFGYILYIGFVNEEKHLFDYIIFSLAISVLCLTKASGLFLALIAAVPTWILSIRKKERKEISFLLTGIVVGILVGKVSWSVYLKITETGEAWNTSAITLENIIQLIRGKGAEYQYTVITNFINALSQQEFNSYVFNMKYLSWVAAWGIVSCLICVFITDKRRPILSIYQRCIWTGLAIYTLGMLILYIFTYSEYEAVRLASFQRYLATYFIGIAWFAVGVMGRYFAKARVILLGTCTLLLFMPLTPIMNVSLFNWEKEEETLKDRENYKKVETYIPLMDYRKDKVWIISQNNSGRHFQYLKYMLAPIRTNLGFTWSLGEPYYEGDIWTTLNYTPDEWLNELERQDYTLVYLYRVDDIFKEKYSEAFAGAEIISESLYQLKEENGKKYLSQVK